MNTNSAQHNHFNCYLTARLHIKYPLILAPMFLVSNEAMMHAAYIAGAIGCIPALNFKETSQFEVFLISMNEKKTPVGVNIIVSSANPYWKEHLRLCAKYKVAFIITSLGSPEEVIKVCKPLEIPVFCDVINEEHAAKVVALGADALIAVNNGAGGHLGKIPSSLLIPSLKSKFNIPVIAAGGVGESKSCLSMFALGADGISAGSPFLATTESGISKDYKDACIQYGAEDIAVSTKISGSPCTVIETPYVKKIGLTQNWLEKFLSKHKKLKKYVRMLTYYKGMKALEKAAFQATYQSVWCAGPSIEFTKKSETVEEVVQRLMGDITQARAELNKKITSN
jgi:nitronate monooxygenase